MTARRAVPFFKRSDFDFLTRNHYVFMFLEDLRNACLHYLNLARFRIVGINQAREYYRSLLTKPSPNDRWRAVEDDTEVIRSFLELVLDDLIPHGEAVVQLIRSEDERKKIIELHPFTPEHLIRVPFYYCQIIPQNNIDIHKRRFTWIPKDDVLEFTMPAILGGTRGHKFLLRRMAAVNRLGLFPSNLATNRNRQEYLSNYDFKQHDKMERIYLAELLKNWEWNCRDTSPEYQTEYYSVYKYIKFRWAAAKLLTETVYPFVGFLDKLCATETHTSSLPNPDYIADVLEQMNNREISLIEAMKAANLGFMPRYHQAKTKSASEQGKASEVAEIEQVDDDESMETEGSSETPDAAMSRCENGLSEENQKSAEGAETAAYAKDAELK